MIDPSKFLHPNGTFYTKGMFLELSNYQIEPGVTVFTTKPRDLEHESSGLTFISFKRLFVEVGDPTGYEFAQEYLHSYDHWKRLRSSGKEIQELIESATEEVIAKIRSASVRQIMNHASGMKSVEASKWLARKGWEFPGGGRPAKKDEAKLKSEVDKAANEFGADIIRLNRE